MGIVYSGDVSSEGPSSGVTIPLPTIPPDEGPSPYTFQVVAALPTKTGSSENYHTYTHYSAHFSDRLYSKYQVLVV
jgi:hypothetical protein